MLENDLPLFYETVGRYRAACRLELDGHLFTPNECAVVMLMMHAPQADISSEIARRLCISPSLVCRSVEALTVLGYLRTEQDGADRRIHRLRLTEKSLPLQEALCGMERRFRAELRKGIPQEDIETFHRVLQRMVQNLREADLKEETANGAQDSQERQ